MWRDRSVFPILLHNPYKPHSNWDITQMAKHNTLWKALRMHGTKTTEKRWLPKAKRVATASAGVLLCGVGVSAAYYYCVESDWYQAHYGPDTQYGLDRTLKEVVTAPYTPEGQYIARKQDGDLQEALHSTFATEGLFFMLTGENGVGKTAAMQDLLRREYKDGVLRVVLVPDMLKGARGDGTKMTKVEAAVLKEFPRCRRHPKAHSNFVEFMTHANEVRKQAKGKDAHPLIIYFDVRGYSLDHKETVDVAQGVSGVARDVTSSGCKAIVEFSRTAVSDVLEDRRGEVRSFQMDAMTEDEFVKIGKKMLARKDLQIVDAYLRYYHDWLGGQTGWPFQYLVKNQDRCMYRLCCLCGHLLIHTSHHRA